LCHPVAMTVRNRMGAGYVRVRSDLTSGLLGNGTAPRCS